MVQDSTTKLTATLTGPDRPVIQISSAPPGYEGEGFPVRRAFAGLDLSLVDPFLMMDEMGEVDYAPGEPKGTSWHPHRGFQTATLLLEGTFEHQDNHGGGGTINPGDTQWMTAGDGILHIEAPPEWLVQKGGLFHGLQLWINLPKSLKRTTPSYQDIGREKVLQLASFDGGATIRLIAGQLGVHEGPGQTHTPITFAHLKIEPGGQAVLPWEKSYNALAYVMKGEAEASSRAVKIQSGHAAAFGAGEGLIFTNRKSSPVEMVVLGGRPIGEPIAWAGPFVMNTRAEVLEAYEDFQKGKFALQTA